jgi:ATP-dependent DNA helicase RecG
MKQELMNRIKAGEDSYTEFKSESFHNESLAKEIVAFSNMKGGTIWIGIEDSGEITGVKDKKLEERVINICRNLVEPSVFPEIKSHSYEDNSKVLEVIITKGDFKPYKVKSQNRIYIRVGSVSIEPSIPELTRLLQSGGQFHFEISSIPGTSISDFDRLRFREYCERYRNTEFDESTIISILQNLQLMEKENNLTVLGMLFFGNRIENKLPQAGIQMLYFEGDDKTGNIIDQKEIYSVIPECIDSAVKFIQNNSKVKGIFTDKDYRRMDVVEYDPFIVRELIANAFCHRDWSIFGQKVRLHMFSDRLELFSPGGLPNTLTLQNALSGISYYRNPAITQICKDYGIVEKAGRGLEKIIRRCKELHLPFPNFECEPEYVKVTLVNNG